MSLELVLIPGSQSSALRLHGHFMNMSPVFSGLLASSDRLWHGLSPIRRRSRTPGWPARSSSAGEGPEQDSGISRGLFQGLGHIIHYLSGVLVEQGVMLHDQEAVVVLFQDGHELERGEGPAHIQLVNVAVQAAEDAGVVAADEEDLVALQFQVAVESVGQQLHGGDQDAEDLGERFHGNCFLSI